MAVLTGPPPTASRAPLKAKAVEPVSGVSGSDRHSDGVSGVLALAGWETTSDVISSMHAVSTLVDGPPLV